MLFEKKNVEERPLLNNEAIVNYLALIANIRACRRKSSTHIIWYCNYERLSEMFHDYQWHNRKKIEYYLNKRHQMVGMRNVTFSPKQHRVHSLLSTVYLF